MNSPFRISRWILCALVAGTFVQAADDPRAYQWLTQAQELALSETVPPPPALNSAEDRADLARVVAAQKARTPAVVAECKLDQSFSYKLFEPIYGSSLTPQNSPKFFQMMKDVLATTRLVNETAKNKYRRLRPYQGHPEAVKALFPVEAFSYPSGHSMGSYTMATVLGAVFPEKKDALLRRAAQIAQSRVDAGVHYPVDIQEGEVLGKATGAAILASSAFQADLAAVKAELKRN